LLVLKNVTIDLLEGEIVMKKFLVLMLVLGLTTAASAVISDASLTLDGGSSDITIAPSDSVVIGITNNVAVEGIVYLYVGPRSLQTLSGATILDPAGDFGSQSTFVYDVFDGFEVVVSDSDPAVAPNMAIGTVFEVTLHCDGEGDIELYLYDSTEETLLDSMTIHQVIPEPITVALLGLGGLFLRRRK
jgi:hypothetical protein